MREQQNCLLLDLDGTVRESISGARFINEPEDQKIIAAAAEAAALWVEKGWIIYGVTNQKGVLDGYKSLESMIAEQQRTMALMPGIEIIHACPDEGNACYFITKEEAFPIHDAALNAVWKGRFRKPEAGMLMVSVGYHACCFPNSAYQVVMVGDRPEDEQAADNALIPFLSAEDWRAGTWPEL